MAVEKRVGDLPYLIGKIVLAIGMLHRQIFALSVEFIHRLSRGDDAVHALPLEVVIPERSSGSTGAVQALQSSRGSRKESP